MEVCDRHGVLISEVTLHVRLHLREVRKPKVRRHNDLPYRSLGMSLRRLSPHLHRSIYNAACTRVRFSRARLTGRPCVQASAVPVRQPGSAADGFPWQTHAICHRMTSRSCCKTTVRPPDSPHPRLQAVGNAAVSSCCKYVKRAEQNCATRSNTAMHVKAVGLGP